MKRIATLLPTVLLFIFSCAGSTSLWLKPERFTRAPLWGMVYDHQGQPCRNVSIRCGFRRSETDFNGRFVIQDLPRGKHRLILGGAGYESLAVDIRFTDRRQIFHAVLSRTGERITEAANLLVASEFERAERILFPDGIQPSKDPETLWLQTWLLWKTGRSDQAATFLDTLQRLCPGNPWLQLLAGEMELAEIVP